MSEPRDLETIPMTQLGAVTGGAGFDLSSLVRVLPQLGQLADQHGAGGKGSQIAGMLGNLLQMFGGAGGGQAQGGAAPQAREAQAQAQAPGGGGPSRGGPGNLMGMLGGLAGLFGGGGM